MKLPKGVIERHRKFALALYEVARHSPYEERLRSTFRRLNETTLRCASLIALSEGRTRVSLMDLLISIEQTEEWASNILKMVEVTDESIRTREVNMIEGHVREQERKGTQATVAGIHRLPRLRNRSREVEGLIDELVAQGRAARDKNEAGEGILKSKGVVRG